MHAYSNYVIHRSLDKTFARAPIPYPTLFTLDPCPTVSCHARRDSNLFLARSTASRHPCGAHLGPVVLTRDSLRSNRWSRPARCDSDCDTRNRRVPAISERELKRTTIPPRPPEHYDWRQEPSSRPSYLRISLIGAQRPHPSPMGRIPHTFSRYEAGSRYACSRVSPLKRLCEHLRSTFLRPLPTLPHTLLRAFLVAAFFFFSPSTTLSSSSSAFDPCLLFLLILLLLFLRLASLRVLFLLFFFFTSFFIRLAD